MRFVINLKQRETIFFFVFMINYAITYSSSLLVFNQERYSFIIVIVNFNNPDLSNFNEIFMVANISGQCIEHCGNGIINLYVRRYLWPLSIHWLVLLLNFIQAIEINPFCKHLRNNFSHAPTDVPYALPTRSITYSNSSLTTFIHPPFCAAPK